MFKIDPSKTQQQSAGSMPPDQFYGGPGVDMLYPGGMMQIPFSDADWHDAHMVSGISKLPFLLER